jgi:hypothetical protein
MPYLMAGNIRHVIPVVQAERLDSQAYVAFYKESGCLPNTHHALILES